MDEEPSSVAGEPSPITTAASLLTQCRTLQSSVQDFQAQAKAQHTTVDLGTFLKSVASELRSLERLSTTSVPSQVSIAAEDDAEEESLRHALRSSNLSFLQTVWDTARRCRHVVALSRREILKNGTKTTTIDVIAEMGLLWVKVVTIGERKLLFEIAKEGWDEDVWNSSEDEYGADSMDGKDGMGNAGQEDEISALPLVKMVQELVAAARSSKVKYRHPEVLILFPNLQEDEIETHAVMKVLASLRATGATIHCGSGDIKLQTLSLLSIKPSTPVPLGMLPEPVPPLTEVLNIDCTILLALISDLSHFQLDEKDSYNEPLKKQLAAERSRPLLSEILYPALTGRKLITSSLAAQRMHEIVETLGTPTEQKRADMIMGWGSFADSETSPTDVLAALRKESIYALPEGLKLPIKIVDTENEERSFDLPPEAQLLNDILSDINISVFLLGWSCRVTTITSNRVVAKQIEHILHDVPGDVVGPDLYVIEIARSLVGKERTRRG